MSGWYVLVSVVPETIFSNPAGTSSSTVYSISVSPSASYFGRSLEAKVHLLSSPAVTVISSTVSAPFLIRTLMLSGISSSL